MRFAKVGGKARLLAENLAGQTAYHGRAMPVEL
jgi:hypothetical protein